MVAASPLNNLSLGAGPSSAEPTGSSKLGKDEFLKLLMAQLGNQDPTAPQDSEQFVAQLAQFASLELAQTTNAQLEALLVAQAGANQLASVDLVGKDVAYVDNVVQFDGGPAEARQIRLPAGAERVTVVVRNDAGDEVARQTIDGPFAPGDVDYRFTGEGPSGPLPPGSYTLEVTAVDDAGAAVDVEVWRRGNVDGVSFEEGYAQLIVEGRVLGLPDVIAVYDPQTGAVSSPEFTGGALAGRSSPPSALAGFWR